MVPGCRGFRISDDFEEYSLLRRLRRITNELGKTLTDIELQEMITHEGLCFEDQISEEELIGLIAKKSLC